MKGCQEIKNYLQAKNYLDGFINYERDVHFSYQNALKLNRVHYLLNSLHIPCQSIKAIHIAGTKGKGSTAAFCANILAASGFKVGLYTSPHFFDFRERIKIVTSHRSQVRSRRLQVRERLISKKEVLKIVKEFKAKLERMRFSRKLGKLTFFEVYTAIAFKYFIQQQVDFAVLETGLGGRLDATNAIRPLVCIITHIGYDHTDKLGKRLRDIAYEKAGIIKRGVDVVSSPQERSAGRVIEKKCREKNTSLFLEGRDFKPENIRIKKRESIFDFKSHNLKLKNLKIFLKGKHQIDNACLSAAGITLLKQKGIISNRSVNFKEGLAETFLEGRFEIAKKSPLTIMDIAHNPSSFSALARSLKVYFPSRKIILIFAASKDKDVKKMLNIIDFTYIILTGFNNPRCFLPQNIKRACRLKQAMISENVNEAFKTAEKLYNKNSLILISGSLFLVSEAKKML